MINDDVLRGFGVTSFRHGQREAIVSIMSGRNTITIFPTGAGKSLVFQYPIAALPGMGVVVSPLIALQKDQVDKLRSLGFAAECLNSDLTGRERRRVLRAVGRREVKFLYTTPETLMSPSVLSLVQRNEVSVLAIDELHTVEWGQGFRTAYSRLHRIRQSLMPFVVIGASATVSDEAYDNFCRSVGIAEWNVITLDPRRDELRLTVYQPTGDGAGNVAAIVKRHQGERGIIYCLTIRKAGEIVEALKDRGTPVLQYTGQMRPSWKRRVQDRWMREGGPVVATDAFGMGIDAPDVRYIVQPQLPLNVHTYLQQIGRAARDGEPADCYLAAETDTRTQRYFLDVSNPPLHWLEALYAFYISLDEASIRMSGKETAKQFEAWLKTNWSGTKLFVTDAMIYSVRRRLDYFSLIATRKSADKILSVKFLRSPPSGRVMSKTYDAARKIALDGYDGEWSGVRTDVIQAVSGRDWTKVLTDFRALKKLGCLTYRLPFSGTVVTIRSGRFAVDADEIREKRERDAAAFNDMREYCRVGNGMRGDAIQDARWTFLESRLYGKERETCATW